MHIMWSYNIMMHAACGLHQTFNISSSLPYMETEIKTVQLTLTSFPNIRSGPRIPSDLMTTPTRHTPTRLHHSLQRSKMRGQVRPILWPVWPLSNHNTGVIFHTLHFPIQFLIDVYTHTCMVNTSSMALFMESCGLPILTPHLYQCAISCWSI